MSKFTTPYGKDVATYIEPRTMHHKIKFVQGGELPEELTGFFTSELFADRAIKNYIEKDKPEENQKTTRTYNKKES